MKLQLLKSNDKRLLEPSRPVTVFDSKLRLFALSLYSMLNQHKALGIAAIQCGKPIQVIIVAAKADSYQVPKQIVMINPEITYRSKEMVESIEGCLSLPGRFFKVQRHKVIKVKFQDTKGNWKELTGDGLWAIATAHEIDHCSGKVIWEGNPKA